MKTSVVTNNFEERRFFIVSMISSFTFLKSNLSIGKFLKFTIFKASLNSKPRRFDTPWLYSDQIQTEFKLNFQDS